jgi:hypothetical protein
MVIWMGHRRRGCRKVRHAEGSAKARWNRVPPTATAVLYRGSVNSGLPQDIVSILELYAQWIRISSGFLRPDDVSKLKADLMYKPRRWHNVPVDEISAECRRYEMPDQAIATIVDLVSRAQAGRRLVPMKHHRTIHFTFQ